MRILVICFLTFCIHVTYTNANKYKESANANLDIDYEKEEKPFRMRKVNLLWTKGKKKLSSGKLADLYEELSVHDKLEAQLKRLRGAGKDEDGALEAKALKSYARIVEHFDLEERSASGKRIQSNEILFEEEDEVEKETQFEDPKLQSMWRQAQLSSFSKKDLVMLKEEFQHQQIKINEFNFLLQELGGDPELMEREDLYEENIVDPKFQEGLSEEELKEKEMSVRENHTEIQEGYRHLETLVSSVGDVEPEFTEKRVYKLWVMAKRMDWPKETLEGFKEELKHFEHRLGKQTFYKDQLQQSEGAIERMREKGLEIPEKHKKLVEKNEFLDRQVNKLYTELKSRLIGSMNHSEL